MDLRVSNWAAATAVSLVLAALAGCSGAEPDNAPPPPPPPPEMSYAPAPADLAGAPPAPDSSGLAGGAREAPPAPAVEAMAPIPNPEDLPPAERHRIYGYAYDEARGEHPRRALPHAGAPARTVAAPARPAQPRTARPAAIVKAPIPEKPAAAAAPDPKLAQLQAALGLQVSAGATLTPGVALSQRLEGPVVLTLPPTLFNLIRREAAKLGLGRAASVSEVGATLSGQGYVITPNGPQTARLKSGEAASFEWQVKPGAGEPGPLRAQVDAVLRGQSRPIIVPLATIEKTVATPNTAKGPQRGIFNWGDVDVPGVGRMRWETVVGGGLLLLALLALVAIARNASEAEARARRRRQKAAANVEAEAARHGTNGPTPPITAPSEPKAP